MLLQIASDILSIKKQAIDDYINSILSDSQPLDQIGICCFTRMYHLHIGIIMDTMFWTTHQDHDINKCDKILGFKGGLRFVSMKWKTTPDSPEKSTSEQESETGTSDKDTSNPPAENIEITYNLRPRKPIDTTCDSSPEPEGYNLHSRGSKPSPEPSKKPSRPPRQPKPTPKPGKPGKVVFQSYGLRRPRSCVRNFICIICNKKFDTQGSLNKHIMTDHPAVHFTCTYCNKQFQTTNGHYKHEQSH